jgi:4-hydroxy-tetrahydrodipicolinate synthase
MVVPYYNKPPQEGLYRHFKAIAEATSLPCMLYNVPARTVVNLSAETVIRLSKIDNIVAIKEASANLGQIARIIEETDDDFLVYSGNDSDLFPVLALGGYGVVSVASHIVGLQLKQMITAYIENRPQEAAAIHRKLLPLIDALFVVSNPIPVKFALNHLGFYVGSPRLPLIEADENARKVVLEVLKNCKIDLPVA